ncbi:hypothetical protein [Hathewaya massiliensis]|uniref:hypothetical protein n=1 Tax=Hathewaya massiliensis TaxID=1964382 RepID=UPI00115B88A2|nr:hypothetical protein [Hathewaya massiliensis]
MNKKSILSNNIAKGGIFTALGIICVYLSVLIPVNTLFFLLLASAIIPLTLLSTDMKTTIVVYLSTALLSLILVPTKSIGISYLILFGIYGIIKYFIEKLENTYLEILLKLGFLNITMFIIYFFYKTLLFKGTLLKLPLVLIVPFMQVVFAIYDYTLTVFINYSKDKIIKNLK